MIRLTAFNFYKLLIIKLFKQMLEGEIFANNAKKSDGLKADALKIKSAREFFNIASKDEGRHARILEGILQKYNK